MKYVKSKFTVWEALEIQTVITGFHIKTRWYELFFDGRLCVSAGYPWDGATGAFDTKDIILASCIHDILCELLNAGKLPQYVQALADEQFRLIEKNKKMWWPRRMWTYMAVRFYQINKKTKPKRKVYEA